MEHVDGVSLSDIPSEDLSDDVIAAITKAVGSALAFAHKNGVLHLDIKPDNILIDCEGQVKLADFGLAQLSRERRSTGGARHGHAVAGTVGYMPLEQLCGDEVSEATDQWALAAVLYELLSDEYPYFAVATRLARKPDAATLQRAQEADEVALLELGSPVLDGLFTHALSRNPEARFDSVKSFIDALLPELGGEASAGKRELKAIVRELVSDEPDEDAADRDAPTRERGDRRGTFAAVAGTTLKIIGALSLALCLLAVLAPNAFPFSQLAGNNRTPVIQVSAGIFIIVLSIGLLAAFVRARQRRNE